MQDISGVIFLQIKVDGNSVPLGLSLSVTLVYTVTRKSSGFSLAEKIVLGLSKKT